MTRVGFIGLGNMGANMASQVLQAGFNLTVYDIRSSAADELVDAGATRAESIADCARNLDILITSLPRPGNVQAAMTGEDGALANLSPGSIWVDMTTNDTDLIMNLAEEAAHQSIAVIDAPVTGAVDGARTGTLTIFAGGPPETLAQVQPVLECMGRVIHCGDLGTGNAVKLVTNYLWFTHAAVIGEGLMLGKRAGVSLDTLWDAIKHSVGDSFVARHDVPSIFAGHYDPSFTLGLCIKDIGLCEALADRHAVPTPVGSRVAERFRAAAERYGEDAAELHVARLIEDAVDDDLRYDGDFTPHWEV